MNPKLHRVAPQATNNGGGWWRLLMVAWALAWLAAPARAEYPDRPLHLVLPFAPGGASDAVARILAPELSTRLGQPVIVENRPGAEGLIAGQAVAAAAPDGYTILYAVSATAALPIVSKTPFDMTRDFTPLCSIGTYDFGMFVSTALPVHSVREFVAYVKAHPGTVNFATLNVGEHLAATLFMRAAGIEMRKIPYRSMSQILPDLVGGQVQVNFGPLLNGKWLADAGRTRVLASLGRERSPSAPELPTMAEAGLPGVKFESVQMLFAPAKTPRDIVDRLAREVNAILAKPDIRARLEKLTLRVKGGTPEDLRREQVAANTVWARFAREHLATTQ
jgi:tripartite-type tricarboxylate transporter receptor subunit TctC